MTSEGTAFPLLPAKTAIQIGVLPRRAAPAQVCPHAVHLETLPGILVAPQVLYPVDRIQGCTESDGSELEARRCAGGDGDLIGIDDRVGQSAHARHDRDAPVAHGAELRQAAWLEPRG